MKKCTLQFQTIHPLLVFHTTFVCVLQPDLLVELDSSRLNECDVKRNSPLHYVCQGGKLWCGKVFVGKACAFISERNMHDKLPIQLLCESQVDRESLEYVETTGVCFWHTPRLCSILIDVAQIRESIQVQWGQSQKILDPNSIEIRNE